MKILIDSTYFSLDLDKKTITKVIELIPGKLAGRKQDESKMSCSSSFALNDEKLITGCINGKKPFYSN